MAVTMRTTITQGEQSKADNTTKVTVKTSVTSTYGSYNHYNPSGTYKIYNSTSGKVLATGTFSRSFDADVTTQIFKKTFTLEHDSDGTLAIKVLITFDTGVNAGTLTNEKAISLPVIARESTVTAISCDIGESTIITINRNDDSFTHTLQYGYSKSPTKFYPIISKTKRTSYGWTVPDGAYEKCPEAKYVNVTIKCITYLGTKEIGTDTCTFKAYANEDDCKPGVSIVAKDVNPHSEALTGNNKRIIKGISNLSYEVSVTPKNGAERKSVSVVNDSQKLATWSGEFKKPTSATIKATVIDSRGYSNEDTTDDLTLVDYGGLSISAAVKWLTFADGVSKIEVTLSGKYSDIKFGAKNNKLELKYKCIAKSLYEENNDNLTQTNYVAIPDGVVVNVEGGKFTATFEITQTTPAKRLLKDGTTEDVSAENLDYREAYSFRFMAKDLVFDSSEDYQHKYVTKHLSSALPIFDWGKTDFNFNVPVYYKGKIAIDDSGWLSPTFTSNFQDYKEAQKVRYRKVGNRVFISGALKPTDTLDTSSVQTAFTLPDGFRPIQAEHFLCQGSNENKWLCTVTKAGSVAVSRYGITETTEVLAGTWLPMSVSFLAD